MDAPAGAPWRALPETLPWQALRSAAGRAHQAALLPMQARQRSAARPAGSAFGCAPEHQRCACDAAAVAAQSAGRRRMRGAARLATSRANPKQVLCGPCLRQKVKPRVWQREWAAERGRVQPQELASLTAQLPLLAAATRLTLDAAPEAASPLPGPAEPQEPGAHALRDALAAAAPAGSGGGPRGVADAAPTLQLAWLLDAGGERPAALVRDEPAPLHPSHARSRARLQRPRLHSLRLPCHVPGFTVQG